MCRIQLRLSGQCVNNSEMFYRLSSSSFPATMVYTQEEDLSYEEDQVVYALFNHSHPTASNPGIQASGIYLEMNEV